MHQSLQHPGCLWCVKELKNGDFLTGCQDGMVRVWSMDASKNASPEAVLMQEAFTNTVEISQLRKQKGPDAAEIASYPSWHDRGQHVGPRSPSRHQLLGCQLLIRHRERLLPAAPRPQPARSPPELGGGLGARALRDVGLAGTTAARAHEDACGQQGTQQPRECAEAAEDREDQIVGAGLPHLAMGRGARCVSSRCAMSAHSSHTLGGGHVL